MDDFIAWWRTRFESDLQIRQLRVELQGSYDLGQVAGCNAEMQSRQPWRAVRQTAEHSEQEGT
jgi:hypothetical protein